MSIDVTNETLVVKFIWTPRDTTLFNSTDSCCRDITHTTGCRLTLEQGGWRLLLPPPRAHSTAKLGI